MNAPRRVPVVSRPGGSTAAAIIGNVLEWYDFALFGFLAPVIGARFFPSGDSIASLLQVFAIFAAGYLVRPLGGVLFGHLGDRYGRRIALLASIALMTVPTTCVGLLPTYASAGLWAPALLVMLRLLQGLSAGGELIASIVWIAELAPPRRRGLFTSSTTLSATAGMLLGSGAGALLTATLMQAQIEEWGWRLPFLAGSLLGVLGLRLRRGLGESPAFAAARAEGGIEPHPLCTALSQHGWRIAHLCALLPLFAGGYHMLFVWMPTYLGHLLVPPVGDALLLNTVAMAVLIAMIPLGGLAADHLGRRRVLLGAAVILAVLALPLFLALSSGNVFAVLAAQLTAALPMAMVMGTIPVVMVELFPPGVRSSAAGLGYNLTIGLLGGTAPLICTWLIARSAAPIAPAFYLAILAAVSAAAATRLDRAALTSPGG